MKAQYKTIRPVQTLLVAAAVVAAHVAGAAIIIPSQSSHAMALASSYAEPAEMSVSQRNGQSVITVTATRIGNPHGAAPAQVAAVRASLAS